MHEKCLGHGMANGELSGHIYLSLNIYEALDQCLGYSKCSLNTD